MNAFLLLLFGFLSPVTSFADEAKLLGVDPAIEKRVMHLSAELRCLVCQGQSLAESHSDFANDMRDQIRDLMFQGLSDQEVRDWLVQRYGDYILYRPPLKSTTVLLWFGPLLLFVIGASVLIYNLVRRRSRVTDQPLSAEEHARAQALLHTGDKSTAGESKA